MDTQRQEDSAKSASYQFSRIQLPFQSNRLRQLHAANQSGFQRGNKPLPRSGGTTVEPDHSKLPLPKTDKTLNILHCRAAANSSLTGIYREPKKASFADSMIRLPTVERRTRLTESKLKRSTVATVNQSAKIGSQKPRTSFKFSPPASAPEKLTTNLRIE